MNKVWKTTFIMIGIGILLIIVSLFVLKMELNKQGSSDEPDLESDQEPEKFTGGRKGFYYDRNLKRYVKAKVKIKPVDLIPEYPNIVKGEIIEPGASGEGQ